MQESVIYQAIQKEVAEEIALNLLREGLSIDIIAPCTGLAIEEVKQLQQQLGESSQKQS